MYSVGEMSRLPAYGYLWIFSLLFFANFVLGLCNHERVTNPVLKQPYSYYWLILHIVFSTLLVALIPFHVYVTFAFK